MEMYILLFGNLYESNEGVKFGIDYPHVLGDD